MTGSQVFMLVIMVVIVPVIAVGAFLLGKHRDRIRRRVLDRLRTRFGAGQPASPEPERRFVPDGPRVLSEEERSLAELERLQRIIAGRKKIAWESDISYHLWGFYKDHLRNADPGYLDRHAPEGEWYEVRVLKAGAQNGLRRAEFDLKGARYVFVDDEERHAWTDKIKLFSLSLHDDSGRCLIEIPIKVRVDRWGSHYSVVSDGPNAFRPGDWVSDFVNVILKHQSLRNREIREQKHRDRLWEIEELKDRFGIPD